MEKVLVRIPGAGSLEVEWTSAKDVLSVIDFHLGIEKSMSVRRIKRGPRKKAQKAISGDSEVENTDQ